jgi:hypothetical protein
MGLLTSLYFPYILLIIFLILLSATAIIIAYAQSGIPATPITSKVFRSNYSSIPLTNTPSYTTMPKLSKAFLSNYSSIPLTNTPSYTTTNATFSLSTKVLYGDVSRQFKESNITPKIEIITGKKMH